MTPDEIKMFVEENGGLACVLVKRGGRLWLAIGETQSDGAFRHVDLRLPVAVARDIETARDCLAGNSPEGMAHRGRILDEIGERFRA